MRPVGDKSIEGALDGRSGQPATRGSRSRLVTRAQGVERTSMPAPDRWRLGRRIAFIVLSAAGLWGLILWAFLG